MLDRETLLRERPFLAEVPLDLIVSAYSRSPLTDQYAAAMERGDVFPPVSLCAWCDPIRRRDGSHRITAMRRLGRRTILAKIDYEAAPLPFPELPRTLRCRCGAPPIWLIAVPATEPRCAECFRDEDHKGAA
jgi:hypothetical protein